MNKSKRGNFSSSIEFHMRLIEGQLLPQKVQAFYKLEENNQKETKSGGRYFFKFDISIYVQSGAPKLFEKFTALL